MTKSKLLELCIKLEQNDITVEDIQRLKELSDEEIDIVLKSPNKKEVIELIKNENFKKLSFEIKQELIKIINSCHELSGSLRHVLKVATDINAISSNQVVELCRTISKSKGIFQSYKASLVACNLSIIGSGQVLELVKMISSCQEEEQANIAYCAAVNPHIIRTGRVEKIVELITEAPNNQESLKIYYEILNISKDIKVSEALANGQIPAINFWEEFIQNSEEAISLLDSLPMDEEITPHMLIYGEKSKSKSRKRID